MKTKKLKKFYENVTIKIFDNGLKLYILEKSYNVQNITVGVNFGSLDNIVYDLPLGSAHLIEHLIFESNHKENQFRKIKNNLTASTDLSSTTFSLNTTNNIISDLLDVLSLLNSFSVNEKKFQQEKKIIEDEISIYKYNFIMKLKLKILSDLYSNSSIQNCIGGTISSLNNISIDDAMKIHAKFYDFSNLSIVLTTDKSPEKIINSLEGFFNNKNENDTYKKKSALKIFKSKKNSYIYENGFLFIGLSLSDQKIDSLEQRINIQIGLDSLFGKHSTNYQKLKQTKLIENTLNVDVNFEKYFSYIIIYAETKTPYKLANNIMTNFKDLKNLITVEDLEIAKKYLMYDLLIKSDSLEWLTYQFCKNSLLNNNLYENNFTDVIELILSVNSKKLPYLLFNDFDYYLKGDNFI